MSGPISVVVIERVAHAHGLDGLLERVHEAVERRAPRRRCASARSSPDPRSRRRRSAPPAPPRSRSASAKITFADLPPSSSVTRLIVSAASAWTRAADGRRAREGDLGDVRVLGDALADRAPGPTTTLRTPSGRPASSAIRSSSTAVERRQLGGLQHDRVAGGECRPELPGGDREREVPGRDQPDHAERLAEGHVDAARHRDARAEQALRRARVVLEDVGHHADLATRVRDRLADVARLEPGELVGALTHRRGEPPQELGAVARAHGPPGREGALRARDRGIGVLGRRPVEARPSPPRSRAREPALSTRQ